MEAADNVQETPFIQQYEASSKQLSDLMKEYLSIKKIEREKLIAELHPDARKRVFALKKLQLETIKLEADFHREVYDLEQKYQSKHDPIFKKRFEIINGSYLPTDDECKLPGVEMKIDEPAEGQEKPNGIPNFWLALMKNVKEVDNLIHENDEKVLEHLTDIRAFTKPAPNLSFQLEFHFEPNEFFQNSVLTKTYLMKCSPDDDDPFSFEGPEIYKSIGCEIMWNAGKNIVEQAAGAKSSFECHKTQSFFNFFNPPELTADDSEENPKIESYLEADFEIGHYLKERVVPRAVLFFTGEILDDVSDDESLDFQEGNFEDEQENQVADI